ncbi:uncharacterized protein LOC118190591 [Stegodyphus dumicola]|uniref:uncharacterized protein LOC118190591 n=1 Tax=Stegodyphus dumicola TaxID=202533 RepID=UPI0015A968D1|nr:uncharacterized protein LOC118190591 [Stegodyphus dumicola]
MAEADIARRREIRRRKILESSEARLQRITGATKSRSEEKKNEYSVKKTAVKESVECSSAQYQDNEYQDNEFIENNLQFSKCSSTSVEKQNNKEPHSGIPRHRPLGLSNSQERHSTNGALQRPNVSDYYTFPKKVSDAETRSFGRTRCDTRRNSTCTQMVMETLQFSFSLSLLRPWLVIILGFVVKAYFLMVKDASFFESIFLPYLILELGFCLWTKFESQVCSRSVVSSLIPGFLFICGLHTSAITAFSSVLNILQCVVQDLAVYIFSFIFLHFVCEICK